MPSTTPFARPRGPRPAGAAAPSALRALVIAALLVVLLVVPLGGAPAQSIAAAPPAPSASGRPTPPAEIRPSEPADAPISLDLVSLGPSRGAALAPGASLVATVSATNRTDSPIPSPVLELRAPVARVTARSDLEAWQRDASAGADGDPVASSSSSASDLAPGETREITTTIAADALGYSSSPDLWGPRRVALTLSSGGSALATLRSFIVWRPSGTTARISESVLLPVAADDPGAPAVDAAAFDTSVRSGRLSAVRDLALRPDVDWMLDPALLDPPSVAADPTAQEDDAPVTTAPSAGTTQPSAAPAGTGAAPSADGRALATALANGARGRTILGLPYARADLASIEQAGAEDLRVLVAARGTQSLASASVSTSGTVLEVPAASADGTVVASAQSAEPDVLLTSSASLREDPGGSITPSSVGVIDTGAGRTPVLAPDPVLSETASSLVSGADGELATQRMLAETAAIAAEPTSAPRHVLIAPTITAATDARATGAMLDALTASPWIAPARTGDLLDLAKDRAWTTDPDDGDGRPYALGEVSAQAVRPSGRTADGRVVHLGEARVPGRLTPGTVRQVQRTAARLGILRSTMQDTAPTDVAELATLSAVSTRWRTDPQGMARRAATAQDLAGRLDGRVAVVPASSYNLAANAAGVPITVTNDLDTPVTLELAVSPDRPLVRVREDLPRVTVPAHGRSTVTVPVEAVANGHVELSVALMARDGRRLADPVVVPLTVNPSWENWTTMALVIAMGLLLVVGVLRARRHGSDRRAPAVRTPEDPGTLARTGLSAPRAPESEAATTDPTPPANG